MGLTLQSATAAGATRPSLMRASSSNFCPDDPHAKSLQRQLER
jgi:hypothetical protein